MIDLVRDRVASLLGRVGCRRVSGDHYQTLLHEPGCHPGGPEPGGPEMLGDPLYRGAGSDPAKHPPVVRVDGDLFPLAKIASEADRTREIGDDRVDLLPLFAAFLGICEQSFQL